MDRPPRFPSNRVPPLYQKLVPKKTINRKNRRFLRFQKKSPLLLKPTRITNHHHFLQVVQANSGSIDLSSLWKFNRNYPYLKAHPRTGRQAIPEVDFLPWVCHHRPEELQVTHRANPLREAHRAEPRAEVQKVKGSE